MLYFVKIIPHFPSFTILSSAWSRTGKPDTVIMFRPYSACPDADSVDMSDSCTLIDYLGRIWYTVYSCYG